MTDEFVVKGGSDAELWGDIDSEADEEWARKIRAGAVNKKRMKQILKEIKILKKILGKRAS